MEEEIKTQIENESSAVDMMKEEPKELIKETVEEPVKETAPEKPVAPVAPAAQIPTVMAPVVENPVNKIIKQLEKLPRKSVSRKQYTAIQRLIQQKVGAK